MPESVPSAGMQPPTPQDATHLLFLVFFINLFIHLSLFVILLCHVVPGVAVRGCHIRLGRVTLRVDGANM